MPPIPDQSWSIIAGAGFNGFLIILLLWFGRDALRRITEALDRNTRAVAALLLSMYPHPQSPFHKAAEALSHELDQAEGERKKGSV